MQKGSCPRALIRQLLFQFLVMGLAQGYISRLFNLQPAPRANNVCAGHSMGEFVSNPSDCSKFYYCLEDGEGAEAECPHGMLFNKESKLCDQEANVQCVTVDSNTPVNSEKASVERYCATKALQQNGRIEYVASASSCHHYYICYYGRAVRQKCSAHLHWNAKTRRCDFSANAGCSVNHSGSISSHTNAETHLISCPAYGQHIFPHMRRCDFFVYCIKGHAILQQCPFYYDFDLESKTCKLRNTAHCVAEFLQF